MATPRHTYRYGLDDVEVSLGRVEELLRTHPNPEPLAVSLGRPGDLVADGWNLKVLVEELRAQIEENPGPVPRPNDPVVASALEGLEAWLDETGAGPADRLMISSGHQGAAVFMVSTTFSIAAGVLSEVLRKATVGNRPAITEGELNTATTKVPSELVRRADLVVAILPDGSHRILKDRHGGAPTVTVNVVPEVDREVLGDLAADLAEAVAARLLDRLPVIVDPATGPRGISVTPQQEEAFDREEALRLAVELHGKTGVSSKMVTSSARDFVRFLATSEPVLYAPKLNFLRAWIREHFDGVEDEFEIVLAGTDDAPEFRLALGQLRELVTYLEGIDS